MPQRFVLEVTRALAASPGLRILLLLRFGCACVALAARAARARLRITSAHIIAIVHSMRLEMALC